MIMLVNLMSGYSLETLSPTLKNKPSVTFMMFWKNQAKLERFCR